MIISLPARIILLTAMSLVTLAATTTGAAATENLPCMEEIEKFCNDVPPGAGRIIGCLKGHEKDLAAVCREKVDNALVRFEQARKICDGDIQKYCGEITPGDGRVQSCMKAKKELISPACRKQVETWSGGNETRKPEADK